MSPPVWSAVARSPATWHVDWCVTPTAPGSAGCSRIPRRDHWSPSTPGAAFTGQLRHQLVLVDDTCATPYCDAPVRHADHPVAVRDGGPTSLHNGAGLCEACNYTKELPGWQAVLHTKSDGTRVLDLTSPTGHRNRGRPPDPPGAPDPATRLLNRIVA